MAGTWTANSGQPRTGNGNTFTWNAPDRKNKAAINLTVGSESDSVLMNVIEPFMIKATKNREITYPAGTQGAGMKLTFNYYPMNVSFGNVESKEVSGPATNIWGYFKKYNPADLWHDSGDTFYPVGQNNKDTAEDTASFSGYPSPWRRGGFTWRIPNHFKTKTEGGDGKKFTTVSQVFYIAGRSGRSQVRKAGASVERSP